MVPLFLVSIAPPPLVDSSKRDLGEASRSILESMLFVHATQRHKHPQDLISLTKTDDQPLLRRTAQYGHPLHSCNHGCLGSPNNVPESSSLNFTNQCPDSYQIPLHGPNLAFAFTQSHLNFFPANSHLLQGIRSNVSLEPDRCRRFYCLNSTSESAPANVTPE
jgi:hypothetical protein